MNGLSIAGLGHRYGDSTILAAVDVALGQGDTLALLGASGCGKSTLLRLIAGFEAPSAGRITVDGVTWSAPGAVLVPPHQRDIGMVFQDLALWPGLTALDNAALGLGARMGRRQAREQARQALSICGVMDLGRCWPGELSGGQQQRVALARAVAVEPRWLLLDEPFGGLDLLSREALIKDVAHLVAELGTTLVLVTHDPREAVALCERAIVLDAGRVIEAGSLSGLLQQPASALMMAFRDSLGDR